MCTDSLYTTLQFYDEYQRQSANVYEERLLKEACQNYSNGIAQPTMCEFQVGLPLLFMKTNQVYLNQF